MSDLVPGKRYRVIRDGVAQSATHVMLDAGAYVYVAGPDVTVEELPDPLPTTPGSIVRDGHDLAWQLYDEGWQSTASGALSRLPSIVGVGPGGPRHPFTVLFDAGADQ